MENGVRIDGEVLKQLRKRAKFSQEGLARELGMSVTTLKRAEAAQKSISVANAEVVDAWVEKCFPGFGSLVVDQLPMNHVSTVAESAAIAGNRGAFPLVATPVDPFATVPPLVNFIERPEFSEALFEKLCPETQTCGPIGLEGMGGIGKTMLALGLCHDPKVRTAFPDGIVWLTVGHEAKPSFEEQVAKIALALNQEFKIYDGAAYRTLLKNRALLLVLDNVWHVDDVAPFVLNPGRSRLLYTSRDKSIAGPLGASSQHMSVLNSEQSTNFLRRWSDRAGKLPEPASAIVSECGGLALALSMIGASLKGRPDDAWADTLSDLKKARLNCLGIRTLGYEYETLHAAIAVSVEALSQLLQQRYLGLAVLLEGMTVSSPILRSLNGIEDREAREAANQFVDRCLAQSSRDGIVLHDLQLDFIRAAHPDPELLAVLHTALKRSAHVIRPHPEQFASQMTGRLLGDPSSGVAAFLAALRMNAPRPWLRPLIAALESGRGPVRSALEGHKSWVSSVAIANDGRRAISASLDHTVIVWDLEGREPPRVLRGHQDDVMAVAITPDGRRAVSGSRDKTLIVWDLDEVGGSRVLSGHTDWVWTVAVSADGGRAVSGSRDHSLMVWDLEGEYERRVLMGHKRDVRAVVLGTDGRRALSGSWDGSLIMWDLEEYRPCFTLTGHKLGVNAVALSADGKRAASGSDDKTVIIWDLEAHQPLRVLPAHTAVTAVALRADGAFAVFGGADCSLMLWDLNADDTPRKLYGHDDLVASVALTPDGELAISGAQDRRVLVWRLSEGVAVAPLEKGKPVHAVALSADGHLGVVGTWGTEPTLSTWNLGSNEGPRALLALDRFPVCEVDAVALNASATKAISASAGRIIVWDLVNRRPLQSLEHPNVRAAAISADGNRVVSGGTSSVRIWDLGGDHPPRIFEGHSGPINSVALTPDGKLAVSASDDCAIAVWNLEGGGPPRFLIGHDEKVLSVAVSADGRRAVSGSRDNSIVIWDLENNRLLRTLAGHSGRVNGVALVAGGKRIISCGADGRIILWDLLLGKDLATYTSDVRVLACAGAGHFILAGDSLGKIHWLEIDD